MGLYPSIMLSLLLLAPLSAATAADISEQPEFLKGDVGLVYAFQGTNYGLSESAESVGTVTSQAHQMGLRAEFGVAPGTSAFLHLSGSPSTRIGYEDPRTMGWNPKEDEGSLLNGLPIEDGLDPYSGGGFEGVWLGVRGTPFAQDRGARATWLIEGAIRTPDGSNLYTRDGSGDGSTALRLSNVFATSRGGSHPYIAATYTSTRPYSTEEMEEEEVFDPSNSIDMVSGIEFDVWQDLSTGRHISLEGRVFFGYNSPATIPSGLFLPSVLPGTENDPVTSAEYSEFGVGFGAHWKPIAEMKVDFSLDLGWPTPHRIESSYPVYSAFNSRSIAAGLSISYLYR